MARAKKEVVPLGWDIEDAAYAQGYTAVCGCDEAGRGPLCGPVVASAVILPKDCLIEGVNDSKKLSEKNVVNLNLLLICSRAQGLLLQFIKINI